MTNLMELPPPSRAEMLAEIDREMKQRAIVYPRLINERALSVKTADRRKQIMLALRDLVERT